MDTLDLWAGIVSIMSLILPLYGTISALLKNKDEYIEIRKTKNKLNKNISIINTNSELPRKTINVSMDAQDDYKMVLYWYCYSIINNLTEFYPKCDFCVSIKKCNDDSVSTILTAGHDLLLDEDSQLIKDNTEYASIMYDGFDYFFVTDLDTFDVRMQKYITSNLYWKYKYNTSIVFPVKSKQKTIGFICINSPQILKKKKKNKLIIKLIEKTSNNISAVLVDY